MHGKPSTVETAQQHFHRDDERIPLKVEPHSWARCLLETCHIYIYTYICRSLSEGKDMLQPLRRKYMRCSSKVTIFHLKKFLARKLQVPATYEVSQQLFRTSVDRETWYSWTYYARSRYYIKTTVLDLCGYPIGWKRYVFNTAWKMAYTFVPGIATAVTLHFTPESWLIHTACIFMYI